MGKKKVVEKGAGGASEAPKTGSKTVTASQAPKKKTSRTAETGRVYINSSYNNTVITVTDDKGDVMAWATAGVLGFAGLDLDQNVGLGCHNSSSLSVTRDG